MTEWRDPGAHSEDLPTSHRQCPPRPPKQAEETEATRPAECDRNLLLLNDKKTTKALPTYGLYTGEVRESRHDLERRRRQGTRTRLLWDGEDKGTWARGGGGWVI